MTRIQEEEVNWRWQQWSVVHVELLTLLLLSVDSREVPSKELVLMSVIPTCSVSDVCIVADSALVLH